MSAETIIAICGVTVAIIVFLAVVRFKMPRRLKSAHYVRKWREIQKLCKNKDNWSHAIIHADMLLDEILKKRKYTGKTMGERLVAAQKKFTSNDKVWEAHKLASALREDGDKKMIESGVKDALVAFRQALRDLRAI